MFIEIRKNDVIGVGELGFDFSSLLPSAKTVSSVFTGAMKAAPTVIQAAQTAKAQQIQQSQINAAKEAAVAQSKSVAAQAKSAADIAKYGQKQDSWDWTTWAMIGGGVLVAGIVIYMIVKRNNG